VARLALAGTHTVAQNSGDAKGEKGHMAASTRQHTNACPQQDRPI
jgi:hypothetical protein